MKTSIFTLLIFALSLMVNAQAPERFQYQTIVRDNAGQPIANQNVSFRINIHEGSAGGTVVYSETHTLSTNDFGLVSLQVGGGTVVSGTMAGIDWGSDEFHLEIELDASGGSSYVSMGTSQLLSVPYALSSGKASNMEMNDLTDAQGSPSNGEVLKWNGTSWAPAADNTGPASTTYTGGTGVTISGTNVISADLGIDIATSEIQNDAVTNAKIANNAVSTAQIANDAVTAAKIDDMGASNGEVLKWSGSAWAPAADNAGSSPWTTSGSNIHFNTGNVGIGLATPVNTFSILQPLGTSNTARFESSDHPAGKDLLELIVPSTASNSSQFIEFQKGNTIVAAIHADGSAKFEEIEFGDNTVQTTAAVNPLAFGSISSTATIHSGSGGYTVTYDNVSNRYEIIITGETYHYTNYTTVVTAASSTVKSFRTSSVNGKLLVYLYNSTGTLIQGNFHFIVYK
ncbi:hypothetical protein [Owenweeksia hongkongensis]|uniref:hypothetical protein n=1 Tax=Owenweeksia hongkongensis TaxID=253245 RepID=UPI003A92E7CF